MGTRKSTSERSVQRVRGSLFSSFYVRLFIVGVIMVGGAIYMGKSDAGQINVANTINNSNQENIDAGGDPIENVATVPEAFRNMQNGGLVPQDDQTGPAPVPEPTPEPVASTTEETSSTTESVDGEDVLNESDATE